jgi:hypothetical protein
VKLVTSKSSQRGLESMAIAPHDIDVMLDSPKFWQQRLAYDNAVEAYGKLNLFNGHGLAPLFRDTGRISNSFPHFPGLGGCPDLGYMSEGRF